MTTKHTPGPWTFVQGGSGDWPTWNVRIGRGMITLPPGEDMRVMDANARLIAAAPDLLEALKKIAKIEDKMVGSDWEEIEEARAIARAAVAKAEGA